MEHNELDLDTLERLQNAGVLNKEAAIEAIKSQQRKNALKCHKYAINQTGDGRWITWVPDPTRPRGLRKIAKTRREDLEDAVLETYGRPAAISMASMIEDWLKDKARTDKPATIKRTRRTWDRYYSGTSLVRMSMESITPRQIEIFAEELIKSEGLTQHQWGNVKLILSQMFNYAYREGIISENPMLKVEFNTNLVRKERKKHWETQVYSNDEINMLKNLAWEDFNSHGHNKRHGHKVNQLVPLAVLFMFVTGLRISEVCAVKWSDVMGNSIMIQRMYSHDSRKVEEGTKGRYGDRNVLLIAEAHNILQAAKERQMELGMYTPEEYIFSAKPDQAVPFSAVAKAFYTYCRQSGIPPKSSHKARKTYGSILFNSGIPLDAVREQLGHVDASTTLNSYVYNRESEEELIEKMTKALDIE